MHLIIDTEDTVNGAPAEREGNRPHSHEGDANHSHPSLVSGPGGEPAERAAATLKLLQEELLSRLFPGVTPMLPLQSAVASSSAITTVMVQLQQSMITLQYDEGHVNDSAEMYCTASHAPPSVIRVSPAAVCCQLPACLPPLISLPETASDCPVSSGRISSGSWITVWLRLSAPLPCEGVTLLARYRGGFLDTRLERAADAPLDALIIKVRVLYIKSNHRGEGVVMKCQCVHSKPQGWVGLQHAAMRNKVHACCDSRHHTPPPDDLSSRIP